MGTDLPDVLAQTINSEKWSISVTNQNGGILE
jgi:hypothetical protein